MRFVANVAMVPPDEYVPIALACRGGHIGVGGWHVSATCNSVGSCRLDGPLKERCLRWF